MNARRALLLEEVYGSAPVPRIAAASLPLHCTALGKALLAGQPLTELLGDGLLPAVTRHTIVRPDVLAEHIAVVERDGVAFSHEEWRLGTSAVAAPVWVDGQVVAALALVGGSTPDRVRTLAAPIRSAAQALGRTLSAAAA
jgi:DNA-binding IclR family transcriptional regulator